MKITVDLENIKNLVTDSKDIFLDPKAEDTIIELLDLQETVNNAVDEAKKLLEGEALKLNPNFSSIRSDKIKVFYRAYGARFLIDQSKLEQLPKELYSTEIKVKAVIKEIEKYEKENETLPDGIIEKDRTKSISISKIGGKDE